MVIGGVDDAPRRRDIAGRTALERRLTDDVPLKVDQRRAGTFREIAHGHNAVARDGQVLAVLYRGEQPRRRQFPRVEVERVQSLTAVFRVSARVNRLLHSSRPF